MFFTYHKVFASPLAKTTFSAKHISLTQDIVKKFKMVNVRCVKVTSVYIKKLT